jgi:predicted metal-dependent hydrolase
MIKLPRRNRRDFLKHKEEARRLVKERIAVFRKIYKLPPNRPNRIAIRNTKSRWGSCSKKGNLNFNYRIVFLPPALADYLVVHELCHLGEFNHSPKFWNLVAKAVPDYKKLQKELRHTRSA